MAISKNELGFVVVGAAVVILLGYIATLQVDVQTYPEVEIAASAGILNAPMAMAPHEYARGSAHIVPVNYTPHRYPTVSGGNITALIHRGFSPLRMRAPMDSKWIEQPPAEVMW